MWTAIVIVFNRCRQILISSVINPFFGFILLVLSYARLIVWAVRYGLLGASVRLMS